MVEWSMELEELAHEKRSTITTDRRSRKRKRSISPSGSTKKSQNEPFESFPKLNSRGNNGDQEANGSGSKSHANGRKKSHGNDMEKLPAIQENGKSGSKLPNLNKGAKHKQGVAAGDDSDLSPELLILPHVKPVQHAIPAKPPRKNVWE